MCMAVLIEQEKRLLSEAFPDSGFHGVSLNAHEAYGLARARFAIEREEIQRRMRKPTQAPSRPRRHDEEHRREVSAPCSFSPESELQARPKTKSQPDTTRQRRPVMPDVPEISLFISYAHADATFVNAIEKRLLAEGVRVWRDTRNAAVGRIDRIVEDAIGRNTVVLLVLSRNSVNSAWVEHEATLACQLELRAGKPILCPVTLDQAWKKCGWAGWLMTHIRKYHVLDFSEWQTDATIWARCFRRLLTGLHSFYKQD